MVVLRGPYSERIHVGEAGGGPRLVEVAGYVPAALQVAQLVAAGQSLQRYRAEAYDFAAGVEPADGFRDPTREPGFDLADSSEIMKGIHERVAARRRARAEAEAAARAAGAPGGAQSAAEAAGAPRGAATPAT